MRVCAYAERAVCDDMCLQLSKLKMAAKKKPELRVYVEPDLDKLIRLLAALHEKTLSDVVSDALERWVDLPENQALIEKHNLDQLR